MAKNEWWKETGKCGTCRFYETWSENQSPLGSGMNWPMQMEDCSAEGDEETVMGEGEGPCPSWKPLTADSCAQCRQVFDEPKSIAELYPASTMDTEWCCSEECKKKLEKKFDEEIKELV